MLLMRRNEPRLLRTAVSALSWPFSPYLFQARPGPSCRPHRLACANIATASPVAQCHMKSLLFYGPYGQRRPGSGHRCRAAVRTVYMCLRLLLLSCSVALVNREFVKLKTLARTDLQAMYMNRLSEASEAA